MSFAYAVANVCGLLKHRCNVVLFPMCSKPTTGSVFGSKVVCILNNDTLLHNVV